MKMQKTQFLYYSKAGAVERGHVEATDFSEHREILYTLQGF